jgi:hypothetical protein
MIRTAVFPASALLVCSLAIGCGGSGSVALVPATGTVTHQGAPVAGAAVTFVPESGPLATAVTDDQGRFTLSTGTRRGVVVGTSKVSVSLGDGSDLLSDEEAGLSEMEQMMRLTERMGENVGRTGQETRRSALPAKYANASTSGLEVTVSSSGTNHFELDLP